MIDTEELLDIIDIPGVYLSVEKLILKANRRQRKGDNKHEPEFNLDPDDSKETARASNRKRNGKRRPFRVQDGRDFE
jgi:hypothetical protein